MVIVMRFQLHYDTQVPPFVTLIYTKKDLSCFFFEKYVCKIMVTNKCTHIDTKERRANMF